MIDVITEPLAYGTTLRALAEIAVIGVVSGAVGCWIVLYELSYSAESLAHGLFPGLVAASLIGAPLLLGGAVGILIASALIVLAGRLAGASFDTAIAVVITALFGAGVLMALSPDAPAGLGELLFGDLLGTTVTEILTAATIGAAVLVVLWLLHGRLLAIGFDHDSGPALGISAGKLNLILLGLVAATILVAVQGLGNLLVAAMLVGPAAAARLLADRVWPMMLSAATVAVAAGFIGIYASYYLKTAAGASVVLALVGCYLLAAGIGLLRSRGAAARH
ncbi:MAG: metal ABC transporter permease [Acidobacteriota bacterium]